MNAYYGRLVIVGVMRRYSIKEKWFLSAASYVRRPMGLLHLPNTKLPTPAEKVIWDA